MPNILSPQQAANFVRTDVNDPILLQLLPLVDQALLDATGHDWSADNPTHRTAILAAGILLTHWYDNPQAVGQLPASLMSSLVNLEGEALKYRKYRFHGNSGAGACSVPGARIGDQVIRLVGVYGLSGNQAAKFEATITADDAILQTDAGNYSEHQFVVVLKHPSEDVPA